MAEKALWKIGGTAGHGTFAVVDVDGVPTIEINGVAVATITAQGAIAELTNSTGGTPGATLVAVGDTTTNQAVPINNNFASINAKLNALITALEGAGVIAS
jgi:hypothetical protein